MYVIDKVSVVIPNYNGMHFLERCLMSLKSQTYSSFDIIIVDNASCDGSIEYIRNNHPKIHLITLDKNMGFAYAVNRGIELSDSEYIFLLNNDTECDVQCIEYLVNFANRDERIFSVNSKMVQMNQRNRIDDTGDEYNLFGIAYKRGYNHPVLNKTKSCQVFSCCAGASLYRRSVFDEIGFFNEKFFMYLEDVDIGYRANLYGYKNYYCSKAKVYHAISGSSGDGKNTFKTKMSARNNVFLIHSNMPILQWILNIPLLIIGFLVKWIAFSVHGYGMIYFKESMLTLRQLRHTDKVKFHSYYIWNYIKVQFRLWVNCFGMIIERFHR